MPATSFSTFAEVLFVCPTPEVAVASFFISNLLILSSFAVFFDSKLSFYFSACSLSFLDAKSSCFFFYSYCAARSSFCAAFRDSSF